MDVKMTSMEESFTVYPRHPRAHVQMLAASHGHSNAHTHLRNLILHRLGLLSMRVYSINSMCGGKKWDPFRVTAG